MQNKRSLAALIFWNTLMSDAKPGPMSAANDLAEGKAALPQDFESALARLEALVSQMETGALPLDQSLAAYEQGVELAKICQRRLDQAEQQVKVLQGNLLKPLADAEGGEE
jgi:exodeoxyribonuclease VII small subunit